MFEGLSGLIIGAAAGIVFTELFVFIKGICKFLSLKFNNDLDKGLLGDWYIHTCIRDENGKFVMKHGEITLRLSLLGDFTAKSATGNLRYSGTAIRAANDLVIVLRPRDRVYFDYTCHRLSMVTLEGNTVMIGAFVSADYNNQVCCGISILSRTEINDDRLSRIISKHYETGLGAISVA
ncbi:MAG: hypothetical protein LBK41_05245 [Clostridiales bacterium]|nr:hypothetical protein [Clostridiales bacterium]